MISADEAIVIHSILIERFGGTKGIRDKALLESALGRPYQTFDDQELYPSFEEKAAAILESIVTNHPFIDGNKRTGYVLARLTLMEGNKDFKTEQETKYQFVISISKGELEFEEIKNWIIRNSS